MNPAIHETWPGVGGRPCVCNSASGGEILDIRDHRAAGGGRDRRRRADSAGDRGARVFDGRVPGASAHPDHVLESRAVRADRRAARARCGVAGGARGRRCGVCSARARRVVVQRLAVSLLLPPAVLYLAFLVLWGFNYRRLPLEDKLPFDAAAVTPEAARSLADAAVSRINALHDAAHAAGWADVDASLAAAFDSRRARRRRRSRRLFRAGPGARCSTGTSGPPPWPG